MAQCPLPVRGHGIRAHHGNGGGEPGNRPIFRRPDDELAALGAGQSGRPDVKPAGWNRLSKPALPKPEYSSIYELHVRDFSISDETVPARHRGTYWRSPIGAATACGTSAARSIRPEHRASAAGQRHRHDRGAPFRAGGAGLRSGRVAARQCASSKNVWPPSPSGTGSTGATTRCTTPPRKAPTPPIRRAPLAPGSSAGWCRDSTAPDCGR